MRKILIIAYLAFVGISNYLYSAEAFSPEQKALAFAQSAFLVSDGTKLSIEISSEIGVETQVYLTAEGGEISTSLFPLMAEKVKRNDHTPLSIDQYLDTEIYNDVLKLYIKIGPFEYGGLGAFIKAYLPNVTSAFNSTEHNEFRASLDEILSPKYLDRFKQGKLILHIFSNHAWISNQEPKIIKYGT